MSGKTKQERFPGPGTATEAQEEAQAEARAQMGDESERCSLWLASPLPGPRGPPLL